MRPPPRGGWPAPLPTRLAAPPELLGTHSGVAAYLHGTVVHVVRFRDRRRAALRIPDAIPPLSGALTATGLTLAFQRENARPAGFIAKIDVASALR